MKPMKSKEKYNVYLNGTLQGDTYAVSEAQAINNIRHRTLGDYQSQYMSGCNWQARKELKHGKYSGNPNPI